MKKEFNNSFEILIFVAKFYAMEGFYNFRNEKIHYCQEGQGECLILVHGFLENLKMWRPQMDFLKAHLRVISIDLPGHGASSINAEMFSMEDMAAAILHFMDLQQIEKAIIVGHSMGGYVAASFASQFPERCKGLGFFHSHAAADSAEAKINRGRAIKVVKENHKNFISAFIPDLFTDENRAIYADEIMEMQQQSMEMQQKGVVNALLAMRNRSDHSELLKKVKFPVMFIIGKQDLRAPMELIKEQIFMPHEAHVFILEDVAHMGFLEAQNKTSNMLLSFALACKKSQG